MIFTLAFLLLAAIALHTDCSLAAETGIITATNLNLRPVAGTQKPPLRTLPKGARVQVLKTQGEWVKIAYEGMEGFVLNRPELILIEHQKKAETATGGDVQIESVRKQAQGIEKKLEASKTEIRTIQKKETGLLNNLNAIDLRIDRHRSEISRLRQDIDRLDGVIAETRESYRELDRQFRGQEDYAARRLVALYKTDWLGQSHIVASADSMYEMFQRRKALEKILDHDVRRLEELETNRQRLKELLKQLNDSQIEKMDMEAEMRHQVHLEEHVKTERRTLLKEIRKKKSDEMAVIAALQRAAEQLDQQIEELSRQSVSPGDAAETPAVSFDKLKGLLPMPVKGKIIYFFGPYRHPQFDVVNFRSGIEIRAKHGEPVTAVGDGKVIFSNWFKGYGNMLIIDHGQSYHTVYAYLEERFKHKGDTVTRGEVIGTAGETGSISGPGVHFEVRHHGKPEDPVKWIKEG